MIGRTSACASHTKSLRNHQANGTSLHAVALGCPAHPARLEKADWKDLRPHRQRRSFTEKSFGYSGNFTTRSLFSVTVNVLQCDILGNTESLPSLPELILSQRPVYLGRIYVQNPIAEDTWVWFHVCVLRVLWTASFQVVLFSDYESLVVSNLNNLCRDDGGITAPTHGRDLYLMRRGTVDVIIPAQLRRKIGRARANRKISASSHEKTQSHEYR